nr:MAG TPA: hypothetical protein [Caudoviricetes sp.]
MLGHCDTAGHPKRCPRKSLIHKGLTLLRHLVTTFINI